MTSRHDGIDGTGPHVIHERFCQRCGLQRTSTAVEDRTFAKGNDVCFESDVMLGKHDIGDWNPVSLGVIEAVVHHGLRSSGCFLVRPDETNQGPPST